MQTNSKTSHTVKDLLLMLDEHDHSLIANNVYFTLEPDGEEYDFMEKEDEKHSLEYILSKLPAGIEFENKKFSRFKKMVGCLVIRSKLGKIMNDLEKDFGCDFYFEDIGIDDGNMSLHNYISDFIIEASKETAQTESNGN